MGLTSAVKNMLSSDDTADRSVGSRGSFSATNTQDSTFVGDRSSYQLPPGTGPGTSGKPAVLSELAMQNDLERSKTGQDTAGYGTDAAAAMGGTLAGTHQGGGSFHGNSRARASGTPGLVLGPTAHRSSTIGGNQVTTGGQAPPVSLGSDTEVGAMQGSTYHEPTGQGLSAGVGRGGVLEEGHSFGHTDYNASDSRPTGKSESHSNQLHPITHETVRHLEIEEISHVKNRERHIHHIQHHTQPVTITEELQEKSREHIRPRTHIKEIHANKPEDSSAFEGQIFEHHDSLFHAEKERTIIDKGTVVNETIHHHVHHVIQPIIEKETIAKERIRTTVPINEVTQEAPIIHQSQMHAPVPMKQFLKNGGIVEGGIPRDQIMGKVMHSGKCVREIDGASDIRSSNKNGLTRASTGEGGGVISKKSAQRNSFDQPNIVSSRN